MITIMITKNEEKIRRMLSRILKEERRLPAAADTDKEGAAAETGEKGSPQNIGSLRDKVIELENTLHDEKRGLIYKHILQSIEKPLIEHVLERTDGNQLKAARFLGINRNTIRSKIRKLAIDINKWKR